MLSYVPCSVCGRVTKERSKPIADDTSFLDLFGFFLFLLGFLFVLNVCWFGLFFNWNR